MKPLQVLIPFDDSESARRSVTQLVAFAQRGVAVAAHLLNVQPGLRSDVTEFVDAEEVSAFHHEEGLKVLAAARDILDEAGLTHSQHVGVGSPADTIVRFTATLDAELVLMGTHGRTAVAELLLGSVATGVLRGVSVPVMLVR